MSELLEVTAPGLLCTVQDLGRPGFQAEGVPPGGAMDPFALQACNLLLGNARGAAGLEMALRGPGFRVLAPGFICVGGADLGAELDGAPVPRWTVVAVRAGQALTFGAARDAAWACLCIAGGVDVPVVMGSRSTLLRAGMGGVQGRALRAGDRLAAGPAGAAPTPGTVLPRELVPLYGAGARVRVVPGPQEDRFNPSSLEAFYSEEYRVTPRSDRMGTRLSGSALAAPGGEMPSEGTALGAVQVPPDGQPIVLMPDRQVTGGYPVIATVASVDVPVFAQCLFGSVIRFSRITAAEAREAARRRLAAFDELGTIGGR